MRKHPIWERGTATLNAVAQLSLRLNAFSVALVMFSLLSFSVQHLLHNTYLESACRRYRSPTASANCSGIVGMYSWVSRRSALCIGPGRWYTYVPPRTTDHCSLLARFKPPTS